MRFSKPEQHAKLLVVAGSNLVVDVATSTVVQALQNADISFLLFKGPTIADWLYEKNERSYSDTDLLIRPSRFHEVAEILGALGFYSSEPHPAGVVSHPARCFVRGKDGIQMDVHWGLFGLDLDDERWAIIEAETELIDFGSGLWPVPTTPLRLLLTCIHSLQHQGMSEQANEDLRRAVALPSQQWLAAGALARRLSAEDVVDAALTVLDHTTELKSHLALSEQWRPEVAAAAANLPPSYQTLRRLRELPARRRMAFLLKKLLPPTADLDALYPHDTRSRPIRYVRRCRDASVKGLFAVYTALRLAVRGRRNS